MARRDVRLDAMLRHLGATYYQELHGQATFADVTRAVDTVEKHVAREGDGHAIPKHPRAAHHLEAH